ncbi:MAG: IreB family regulatory phosphoprotein [Firmicutes bacterium]|jgi:uncharacterized protein (UPF0297 family)|nr:IreB family regulatory phosphoprotein [Bacillota bacterium]
MDVSDDTRMFSAVDNEQVNISETLRAVCKALEEKGYEPLDQIVGYLVSGDPSYITSHGNARQMLQRIERNDLLEEMVGYYIKEHGSGAGV